MAVDHIAKISDRNLERMKRLAEPLRDTVDDVIGRLLDFYEQKQTLNKGLDNVVPTQLPQLKNKEEKMNATLSEVDYYAPDEAPDLRNTRIIKGDVNGKPVKNWNKLIEVLHEVAFEQLGSYEAVFQMTKSNIVHGVREDNGFHFKEKLGISIQNVETRVAWQYALYMARKLLAKVNVHFEWRDDLRQGKMSIQ